MVMQFKVLRLAKPDAGRLILATIALLIASTSSILIPKFGGKIIDIVSKDMSEPEQKAEALAVVKNTVLYIVLIVVVGSADSEHFRILNQNYGNGGACYS